MRQVLVIIFAVLYVTNYHICSHFYPEFKTDYLEHGNFIALRETIFEIMFFIALLIPLFKKTFISKISIIAVSFWVMGSIIDKLQGVNSYHIHDIIVILGSLIIARELYLKNKKKNVQE